MIYSILGDARDVLAALDAEGVRVHQVVTSPPYLEQRTYGPSAVEIGHEATLDGYVTALCEVFAGVRPLLEPGALVWVNLGDKANGSGGAGGDWDDRTAGPSRFRDPSYPVGSWLDVPGAFKRAMLLAGWRLRADVIWDKGRDAPESLWHVRRPRPAHEHLMAFQADAGRSRLFPSLLAETGTVWHFPPGGSGPAHLAPFPDELAVRCILPTTMPGDWVLDPFGGSGTVARVADRLGRHAIHVDLYTEAG